MLTEQRTEIKTALEAAVVAGEPGMPDTAIDKPAGFKAFEYIGEALAPPCAAIVPAEPYLLGRSDQNAIPFREVQVGIDVLLISAKADAKTAARLTDELIEYAYRVLKPKFNVGRVSRPGVIQVSGAKYIGSVLSIEQTTEEP